MLKLTVQYFKFHDTFVYTSKKHSIFVILSMNLKKIVAIEIISCALRCQKSKIIQKIHLSCCISNFSDDENKKYSKILRKQKAKEQREINEETKISKEQDRFF